MAVMLCPRHGRQVCEFVSALLAEHVNARSVAPGPLLVLRLELLGAPGSYWIDEGFADTVSPGRSDGRVVHIEDEETAFDVYSRLSPVCGRCYGEYLSTQGLPDAGGVS